MLRNELSILNYQGFFSMLHGFSELKSTDSVLPIIELDIQENWKCTISILLLLKKMAIYIWSGTIIFHKTCAELV